MSWHKNFRPLEPFRQLVIDPQRDSELRMNALELLCLKASLGEETLRINLGKVTHNPSIDMITAYQCVQNKDWFLEISRQTTNNKALHDSSKTAHDILSRTLESYFEKNKETLSYFANYEVASGPKLRASSGELSRMIYPKSTVTVRLNM